MDTAVMRQDIFTGMANSSKHYANELEALDFWNDILIRIPEDKEKYSIWKSIYKSSASLTYHPQNEEDADEIRSQIQKEFNVIAKRDFNSQTGKPYYKFEIVYEEKILYITINNAHLAPGCELKERRKMTKYYELICPVSETEEVTS